MIYCKMNTGLKVNSLHGQSPYSYPVFYSIIISDFLESIVIDNATDDIYYAMLKNAYSY